MQSEYKKYMITAGAILASGILLTILMYVFLLLPQKDIIKTVKEDLEDKKQELQSMQNVVTKKSQTELLVHIEDMEKKLSGFVLDFEDTGDLTFDLTKLASQIGVGSFSCSSRRGPQEYEEIYNCYRIGGIYTTINFKSSFNKFARLLNSLERNKPIVLLDKFSIERKLGSKSGHAVEMSLVVFVQRPPEEEKELESQKYKPPGSLNPLKSIKGAG